MMAGPSLKVKFGRRQVAAPPSTGGCDEECDCIETLVKFSDEFCDVAPTQNVDNPNPHWEFSPGAGGLLSNLERSNGWWRLSEASAQNGPQIATLQERFHCWAIKEVFPVNGPTPPEASATLRYKTKLFVSNYVAQNPETPQLEAGLRNSLDGRGAFFRTRETGLIPNSLFWDIVVSTGGFGTVVVQTNIPVGRTCKGNAVFNDPGAQLLEIRLTFTGGAEFFINGVSVGTVPAATGAFQGLLGDVFKAFYETSGVLIGEEISVDIDFICITQTPRLCQDKQQPF